jgi:glycosyltransferase involved in cell wall biosynthesis
MFSVIIPLYNKETFIARTLQSVLDQTFQEFEIIIVNDGSTDGSVKEVERFNDERIRLIEQTNAGVSAARNRGIEEAKYDLIAFLDADDEWLPDYLMTIYSLINKYSTCSVFATQYILKSQSSSQSINTQGLPFDTDGIMDNYFYIASNNMPPLWTSAICVKKEAMKKIGGFPLGIKSGEDLLTWARLAAIYQIAFNTSHLSIYHNDVERWEPGRPTYNKDIVGIELKKLLKTINEDQKNFLKNYIGFWHKMRASTFIRHNQRVLSIKETILSIFYNPWNIKTYAFFPLAFMPNSISKYLFGK